MQSILFLTPNFGNAFGGVGASAERIVGYLRSQFDVTVIVPDKFLSPGKVETRIDTLGLTIQSFGPYADQKLTNQFCADLVLSEGRSRQIQSLCAFYIGQLAYAATFAAKLLNIPLISCARGNDIDADIFGDQAFQIHHVLNASSVVCCVSEEMEAKVKAWSEKAKTVYIPNGIDPVQFPYQEREEKDQKTVIGLFGEIKSKKGLDILLEAVDFSLFSLKIVGRLDDESAKLLHGYLTLNPEADITHTPFVKRHVELLDQYRAVDIVCIPSLYDGMPNVLLEAMSCGKVVVASEVGGALDVIKDNENGFLFERKNSLELKEKLLHAKDAIESTLSRAARETIVNDFNWEREMQAYLDVFTRKCDAHL